MKNYEYIFLTRFRLLLQEHLCSNSWQITYPSLQTFLKPLLTRLEEEFKDVTSYLEDSESVILFCIM